MIGLFLREQGDVSQLMTKLDLTYYKGSDLLPDDSVRNLIRTLLELLFISSPSGKEADVRNYSILHMERSGLNEYHVDRAGNLYFTIRGDNALPTVCFTSHMDNFLRRHETMSPGINGNRIVNTHSSILGGDNKAGLSVFLELGRWMVHSKEPHGDIKFLFTVHEEHRTPRGWSYGAKNADPDFLKDVSLMISMDVPCGKNIQDRNFLIYHMPDNHPVLEEVRNAALNSTLKKPYLESEKEGFIGGDATTFYREFGQKVIDFGSGVFSEHTRRENVDMTIFLEQARWIFEFYDRIRRKPKEFFSGQND